MKFLEIDSTDLYEILTQYDYVYGLTFAQFSSKLIKKRGDKLKGRKKMSQKVGKNFFGEKIQTYKNFRT